MSVIKMQVMQQPGSLERVLRVIRHRGFNLLDLTVNGSLDNQIFSLMVMVSGERPLSFLTKQLKKLVDVNDLSVNEQAVNSQAFNAGNNPLNKLDSHYANSA
ncbi:acetolactate synthase 2 small subunit [Pleionea mediterranea]|uniref:Acetolactate synthase small subunit n=1 Tax=Pleionea mediterranea TaxID=523701 RepID=A0A316GF71_9GAMM|nr:acetolactate synthase 2 small subunit [Pleionea mediterranea]PWK53337.1 acetolactate synthase small subunit [Pleionea mediterranea]